ncbi:MAG: hypothetical protein ACRC56_08315 [Bosea sp. (in: a-proteobacteria)]
MTTILILLGLTLFVLRSQLLRIGMQQAGVKGSAADMSKVHASPLLGAISGWLSLLGASMLMLLAFNAEGWLAGGILIICGIAAGILASALAIPLIGSTQALGYEGGEGLTSVAEFNRQKGAYVALAVAACAALAWAIRLRLLG